MLTRHHTLILVTVGLTLVALAVALAMVPGAAQSLGL